MKRNKGFSLIELIIAIAILIILTGLLAPQFMKYIEASKRAKRIQEMDNIYHALEVAYIDATNKGWDKFDERSGMIIITFGETGGKDSIDQYVCDNMRSFIGDEMNKISLIMAPATHSESGEKVDVDNFFVINDVVIQYYPNPDKDKTHYFFYQKGYEDTYKGKYGEWNNKQIVWYQD